MDRFANRMKKRGQSCRLAGALSMLNGLIQRFEGRLATYVEHVGRLRDLVSEERSRAGAGHLVQQSVSVATGVKQSHPPILGAGRTRWHGDSGTEHQLGSRCRLPKTSHSSMELMVALDEECDAAKKRTPSETVSLRAGRQYASSTGYYQYSFLLDQELDTPSDTRGLLQVGDERHYSEVLGVQGYDICLAVSTDLGTSVPAATLLVSHFVLDILKVRLSGMLSGSAEVNRDLVMAVFGHGHYPLPEARASCSDMNGLEELNPEQQEAIVSSLGRAVSFIWGPPGTGKTVTAGRLVGVSLRGERVLVTSHTNVAVDTALLAVLKCLPEDERESGYVVRVGPPSQRNEPELAAVTVEALLEQRAGPLIQERANLRERRRQPASRMALLDRAFDHSQDQEHSGYRQGGLDEQPHVAVTSPANHPRKAPRLLQQPGST
ncbi:MAG: AAA domain-containing protein [Bacillota bacterium]